MVVGESIFIYNCLLKMTQIWPQLVFSLKTSAWQCACNLSQLHVICSATRRDGNFNGKRICWEKLKKMGTRFYGINGFPYPNLVRFSAWDHLGLQAKVFFVWHPSKHKWLAHAAKHTKLGLRTIGPLLGHDQNVGWVVGGECIQMTIC